MFGIRHVPHAVVSAVSNDTYSIAKWNTARHKIAVKNKGVFFTIQGFSETQTLAVNAVKRTTNCRDEDRRIQNSYSDLGTSKKFAFTVQRSQYGLHLALHVRFSLDADAQLSRYHYVITAAGVYCLPVFTHVL